MNPSNKITSTMMRDWHNKHRYQRCEKTIGDMKDRLVSSPPRWLLNTNIQRNFVWSYAQRRKLIKSILEGKDIDMVKFNEKESNADILECYDGRNRIETIMRFIQAPGFTYRDKNDDINELYVEIDGNKIFYSLENVSLGGDHIFEFDQSARNYFNDIVPFHMSIRGPFKSEKERSDTFAAIQNGVAISAGEKLHSMTQHNEVMIAIGAIITACGTRLSSLVRNKKRYCEYIALTHIYFAIAFPDEPRIVKDNDTLIGIMNNTEDDHNIVKHEIMDKLLPCMEKVIAYLNGYDDKRTSNGTSILYVLGYIVYFNHQILDNNPVLRNNVIDTLMDTKYTSKGYRKLLEYYCKAVVRKIISGYELVLPILDK